MQKITVRGKEYDLALTIGAFAEISELCPDGDFSRINELINQPIGKAMVATAKMLAAMSKGAEEQKRFEDPDYTPAPLTFDAIRVLDTPDYVDIHKSFATIISRAMKGHAVEVEPSKKKEKEEEK